MKVGRKLGTFFLIVGLCGMGLRFDRIAMAQEEEDSCIACHRELGDEFEAQVEQWEKSIHKEVGVVCVDCHGGDPTSMDVDVAKSEEAGFLGKPDPKDIPALCAKCHADIQKMRQYNIRTDQYAEYKTSVHGRRLLEEGDTRVATCTSCHSTHEIRMKDDPLATVYHTNVPETCGKCHADPERMKPYGIPTNQLDEYKASYHGQILYKKIKGKNPALVPSCADCHGIHGAAPPGVKEVSNVCGNCHANNAEYYRKSPHYQSVQKVGVPRCIDCHGNHRILYPDLERFVGKEEGHCGHCHDASSFAYTLALEIKQSLEDTSKELERGKKEAEAVQFSGINMEFIDSQLKAGEDKLIEVLPVTHSLNIGLVKGLMDEAKKKAAEVTAEVDKIQKDLQRRKKALLVVILGDFLLVGLLYLKKRSLKKRPG